jgi:N-acylglucosamine 2-epimerase/mannose-6-phosphate isomerase
METDWTVPIVIEYIPFEIFSDARRRWGGEASPRAGSLEDATGENRHPSQEFDANAAIPGKASFMLSHGIEARARRWLFDEALPFWSVRGVDPTYGGFVEQLDLTGADACVDFKRVRVAARQTYVFAHAYLLGWSTGAELARRGAAYLAEKAWMGPERGFARLLTRVGSVKDPTADLYDCAFALFAFAWIFRATGESEHRGWITSTADFIERRLRHPHRGFHNQLPPQGFRLQNPHMHLCEAALAAYEATGEERFAALAREVISLLTEKFYNAESGALYEVFDDRLARASHDEGRRVEPGHQLEWAWILAQARRLIGLEPTAQAKDLIAFAERYGVDPSTGAVYMAVRDDGVPLDKSSRVWANTERIKAAVALYDLTGADPRPVFEQSGRLLLDRYLAATPRGTWIDCFDEHGAPTAQTIPASTLYHLFLAFTEMMRIADAMKTRQA